MGWRIGIRRGIGCFEDLALDGIWSEFLAGRLVFWVKVVVLGCIVIATLRMREGSS